MAQQGAVWVVAGTATLSATVAAWWRGRRRLTRWLAGPLLTEPARQLAQPRSDESGGGLGYTFAVQTSLTRVYTDQQMSQARNRDASAQPAPPHELSVEELLGPGSAGDVVVTGEAGVGKSSLLSRVASQSWDWWQSATRKHDAADAPFPGLLPVRIAAEALVGKDTVAAGFGPQTEKLLRRAPVDDAKWLILIDAVDEITNADDRNRVVDLLTESLRRNSRETSPCRYVITARGIHDTVWRDLRHAGAVEYRLHPFTPEQLHDFVVKHQSGRPDGDAEADELAEASAKADRFVDDMRRRGMLEVVSLPLLACLTADLYFAYQSAEAVPGRRVDIYAQAVSGFLGKFDQLLRRRDPDVQTQVRDVVERLRRERAREPAPADQTETLRAFLAELAERHLDDGQASLTEIACKILDVPSQPATSVERQTVEVLLGATGVIVDSHSQPRFVHQTFAEFLAATRLADRYGADPDVWGRALADANTRTGAIFAFDCQPGAKRHKLIRDLTRDHTSVVQAGRLAAEGLCTSSDLAYVLDSMWASPPEDDHDEWWEAITALGGTGSPTALWRRMQDAICNSAYGPKLRLKVADRLAEHHDDWAELLHKLACDTEFDSQCRIDAADRLVKHKRDTGIGALRSLAVDRGLDEATRIHAARRAAFHAPTEQMQLFNEIAVNQGISDKGRLDIASELAANDRKAGVKLLDTLATSDALAAESRLEAADRLARLDHAAGTRRLGQLAKGHGLASGFAHLRLQAAERLTAYDRAAGADCWRQLATGVGGTRLPDEHLVEAAARLCEFDRDAGIKLLRKHASTDHFGEKLKDKANRRLTDLLTRGQPRSRRRAQS